MDNLYMDSQQTFSLLLERLDYISSPNLISTETSQDEIPPEFIMTWREAHEKLDIDAVYFIANAPVIYFKRFEYFDRGKIGELHRNIWSQSKIPLIFIVFPNEVRIYSGYEAPKRQKNKNEIVEPSRLENKLAGVTERASEQIWERLNIFARTVIESGSFWRMYSDHKYFRRTTRADQKLLNNLRYIRRELIKNLSQDLNKNLGKNLSQEEINGLSSKYANSLIGRSIFALYLQDRGVLQTGAEGFFTQKYGSEYRIYTDLLSSHKYTYDFFEFLHNRFNGDMFPVDEGEKEIVNSEHLRDLRTLFTVDSVNGHQLLFFWAYNFEFIPIELISSIYEEFLHEEEEGKNGTYYTPPRLVHFMLAQVLPESDSDYTRRILDPACGSGIFLVEAYRRLVERWYRVHKEKPPFSELVRILRNSIFGVDIKQEALRIAAFSLYLAMLDYLEPKTIWLNVQFPSLIKDGNLIEGDFFEKRVQFGGYKFHLVIGNPPWESQLTTYARDYLIEHDYLVGDEQIAQAFLWHAPDFCEPQGQIALLCSSKILLFNRSGPNVAFRQRFFRKFSITKIFDFSALRRFLFEKAIAPTAAIFYTPQAPHIDSTVFYGAPKLTQLTRRFAALVIEANDLKHLPLEQILESADNMESANQEEVEEIVDEVNKVEQEELFPIEEERSTENLYNRAVNIWKVALWGTSYDHILLQKLNKYPSLREAIKRSQWISKVGYNYKGPAEGKYAMWLDDALDIVPQYFTRYGIDINKLQRLPIGRRYYRRGIPQQFKAPFILFKRTQTHRQIGAAYLDFDCAYSETFTCIAGSEKDQNILKAVTALLNSELAQYYLFLISASWGVEREEIKAGEMRTLPFPFYDCDDNQIATIAHLVDTLANNTAAFQRRKQVEHELNQRIYECFHLNEQEIQHIRETIIYAIDFFHKPETSLALQEPTVEMKKSYAISYMRSINFYLKEVQRKLTSIVYKNESTPLFTIKFSLNILNENIPDIQEAEPDSDMRQALSRLNKLAGIERAPGNIFHRRDFKIYSNGEDTLYIVKPAEQRLWTVGAALSDAEEMVADLI